MTDMQLLYEDYRAEELQWLPTALERLGTIICNPSNPIPGLPCLPGGPIDREWANNRLLVKTPWGLAEPLWGADTDGLWPFAPLYRLVIPDNTPLPEPQIPQTGYAVWDTVTGLVTLHADDGGEPVHLRPTLDEARNGSQIMDCIRADLARQGIPIFPTRLYRRDSLPYPWENVFKTARVNNREVSVPLVGYALDRGEVVYLHIVGNKSAIRSIWATLHQGGGRKPVYIEGESFLTGVPTGNYVSYSTPVLADTGDYRMVILDRRAINAGGEDVAYLVVPGTHLKQTDDLLAAFAHRLDSVLPIPVLPEWGAVLYRKGVEQRLIRHLTCGGDIETAHAIINDPRWIELVQSLIQSGEIETI